MLWTLARFEIAFQLRTMLAPIVFGIFFLLTFGAVTIDQVSIGSTGNVNVNSPFAIMQVVLIMSLFGLFIPAAMLSNILMRDSELRTEEIFYTLPIRPWQFLMGRFLGAFTVAILVFSSVPIGILIGSFMPWLDPERVGPTVLWHYLYALFVFGGINLLFTGMIFFTVANITRSNVAIYSTLVFFLIVYFVGLSFVGQNDWIEQAAFYDPIGFMTYADATRYWTAYESNAQVIPIEGAMLFNRALYLGLALLLLLLNVVGFSFTARASKRAARRARKLKAEATFSPHSIVLPRVTPRFTAGTYRSQFALRTSFEVRAVVTSIAFWVLMVLGVFNSLGSLLNFDLLYDVPAYPVTRVIIEQLFGTFSLVPFVVAVYYASEIIWREKTYRIHEIVDATPTPSSVFVFSKFLAMLLVLVSLLLVAMVTGIAVQLAKGFGAIEFDLYLFRLVLVFGWPFFLIAMLSLFVQVVSLNRYVGILIMMLVLIAQLTLSNIGFEHNLYRFAGAPGAPLSDMNGNGHYLTGVFWFYFYWTCFSLILMILSYLLWMRGTETGLWLRIRSIGSNLKPATALALLVFVAGFAGSGAFIYYNTNVLNTYSTQIDNEKRSIAYEEAYIQYERIPQPEIVDVKTDVAIYPQDLRVETRGHYMLENRGSEPIEKVHYDFAWPIEIRTLTLEGAELETADTDLQYYIFALDEPLAPGARLKLDFETAWDYDGFRNSGNGTRIVYNGTFVNNQEIWPRPGYQRSKMMTDRNTRRRYDLEPVERMPKLEDTEYYDESIFSPYIGWVPFETIVSTSADQIAVAPGYLQREWQEGDRRYFHYKMDKPILPFVSYLSADYEVARDVWTSPRQGEPDVALEVYYHKPHTYNVDGMMLAMKASFDYFTEHFSPFQFRQMRILEFPDYATFAQSFANTVPYSEGIGFISDVRDPQNIDVVAFVTAHEVAHQWWAHQVLGANVQGSTMLSETFSQYSALMVMEDLAGPHMMRRFLKYELDSYLSNRGSEQFEELPLYRVENQPYIHYRKGAVAMYALKDYVGEDTVNRTMARLIEQRAYSSRPYTTTPDFLRLLREEAGPEHEELIQDLFERIVLWDLKLESASVTAREDGRFDVTLEIEASKFEADGEGRETPLDLDMPIDIGLFAEHPDDIYEGDEHVIMLERRRIRSGRQTVTVTVDREPSVAGIDPYAKLIDRNTGDNLQRL